MATKQFHYFVSYKIIGRKDCDSGVGYREVFLAKPIRGIDDVNLVAGYLDLRIAEEQGFTPGDIVTVITNWQRFESGEDVEPNWLTGESAVITNGETTPATAHQMDSFDMLRHKNPPEGWVPCADCNGAAVIGTDGSACVCAIYGQYPGWQKPVPARNDDGE